NPVYIILDKYKTLTEYLFMTKALFFPFIMSVASIELQTFFFHRLRLKFDLKLVLERLILQKMSIVI
ncbi:MAG: hypothetical protein ACFFG0_40040, partial [Candidatus Thorarchaeota archaeon]